jgi:hypothetical protein
MEPKTMNMSPSRWERTIDALCGVAFVAFLIPFFAYVAVCYAINRISLRILGGFNPIGMALIAPLATLRASRRREASWRRHMPAAARLPRPTG